MPPLSIRKRIVTKEWKTKASIVIKQIGASPLQSHYLAK